MRFASPAMTGALRAAVQNPARMSYKRQTLGGLRHYASQAEPKKGGSKILFATLLGAGVVGGLAYNSSQTKVVPVVGAEQAKEKPTAFNPEAFISLKLIEVEPVSHDTKLFRFAIPEGTSAGLPVASCVVVKHQEEGKKPIIRPYTPVSDQHAEGHVDFIIKKYDTGKLTPVIHDMKPGDTLQFKGPISKYDWETKQKSNVGMVAGGSGITPMLQVIRRVFDEKSTDKKTKVTLIFANRTEGDILLKDELDKIAKQHPDRFKVIYALDKAPENWDGIAGYVTKDVIEKNFPSPKDEDSVIMVCGPPPMVRSLAGDKDGMKQGELSGILKELGYSQGNVFKF
ncbi:uncharacterized protein B0P05DRAFT_547205 [Gilbertella persicaria]|uniref:uncharacterized protein n=1 Tax=Gilbertella persicaria TaxID=101096 RepID=UPI00221F809F|nr:uncharacterized protein B0P05DRAFT_547205 [Gilbertella persicaria]KAI8075361.1 hypothetical protein B0P05DRAFT_547205 [Gilbertella persicaria]